MSPRCCARVLFLALVVALAYSYQSGPFVRESRVKRDVDCNVFEAACRDRINNRNQNTGRSPDFNSRRCDYENQKFWLIPGDADNSTCTRPEIISRGMRMRIFNDTVKISPNPIRLPACFNISFEVEIDDTISELPDSFIGKNEFQLYELPEVEKMQCQNSSNNGCGGYGNNCIYCDICSSLERLDGVTNREPLLNQFHDIRCPRKAGRYLVSRHLCFNDWSVLDKNNDCELDFIAQLLHGDSKPNPQNNNKSDADTLKEALNILGSKGHSTLIARFYLAHNSTPEQEKRKESKERDIEQHWTAELERRRQSGWQVSDQEYASFKDWYIQLQKDTWHKEQYLPWLIYQNELACLKVTFTVCDKEPRPDATVNTNPADGPGAWWERRVRPRVSCPR